jgi:hypothetical protein
VLRPLRRVLAFTLAGRLLVVVTVVQLFGELPADSELGGFVPLPGKPRRPWVYMGPGLFHAGPGGPEVLEDVPGGATFTSGSP